MVISLDCFEVVFTSAYFVQCGSLTGATFGFVDVLRDHKMMSAKKSIATSKILRFTTLFGGFVLLVFLGGYSTDLIDLLQIFWYVSWSPYGI
jgi:hypothetical protein